VDFLHTNDILRYFKLYQPKNVEWINDSSANVVFESSQFAKEAYEELAERKEYLDEWRDTFAFTKDGVNLVVQFRYATDKDVKSETTKGKESKYYKYVTDKRQLDPRPKPKAHKNRPQGRKQRGNDGAILRKKIGKNRRDKFKDGSESGSSSAADDEESKESGEKAMETENTEEEKKDNAPTKVIRIHHPERSGLFSYTNESGNMADADSSQDATSKGETDAQHKNDTENKPQNPYKSLDIEL